IAFGRSEGRSSKGGKLDSGGARIVSSSTGSSCTVRKNRKKFERQTLPTVQVNRLRRFGRLHVFRICCFSLACAARIFFAQKVLPIAELRLAHTKWFHSRRGLCRATLAGSATADFLSTPRNSAHYAADPMAPC